MNKHISILAVDDEPFNLDLLENDLSEVGYNVIRANDGIEALDLLEKHPEIAVVILDKMMPKMDGLEVLKKIKSHSKYQDIPVIMQTAAVQSKYVMEGIKAGAFYYLIKPYDEKMLLAIVESAIYDAAQLKDIRHEIHKHKNVLGLIDSAKFHFRTLEEARNAAYYVASCCPDSDSAVLGLTELLTNAVEHGNLGITYNEKKELTINGNWKEEIDRRLALPENKDKIGTLTFNASDTEIIITITDKGKGFNWHEFLEFSPARMADPHGRGIAMAKNMSFDTLEYNDVGNSVSCTIKL